MLDRDRAIMQKTNSKKISVKSVSNKSKIKFLDDISDCVIYLNNIVPSNKTSLYIIR